MALRQMRGTHARFDLKYHLILITKYRKPAINKEIFSFLKQETIRLFEANSVELLEMNYEPDHVHLLISVPPSIALSKLINSYKTVTSRLIRKEFGEYLNKYYYKAYFWSRIYILLSTGGATIETIQQYIKDQNESPL